jgi:hypothetical protein
VGAASVDHGVIGQDAVHAHALGGEPGHRPVQKPSAGGIFLVGEHFAVGEPGVVVDGGVDVVVADQGCLVPVGN